MSYNSLLKKFVYLFIYFFAKVNGVPICAAVHWTIVCNHYPMFNCICESQLSSFRFRINDKVYFRIADKNNGYWVPCTIVNRESKYKIRLRGKGYRRVHCSTLRERIDSEKYFQGTANKKNDSEERPTRKRRRSFDSFGRELPRRSKRLKRR